ncbi:MAG TPA: gliding motility-associated C-terminal domain-containing protein [Bacteroidia bacterium]|nr:gliding motility-associated C-terminal domain-containing protein [Bacteroidia bacterium]
MKLIMHPAMNKKKIFVLNSITLFTLLVFVANGQKHESYPISKPLQSGTGGTNTPKAPEQDGKSSVLWTSQPFDHQLFIKNAGQFDKDINTNDKVLYGAQVGRANAYFTINGLTYKYKDIGEPKKAENKEKEKKEREEQEKKEESKTQFTSLVWIGSNPNASIEAEEKQSYSYGYPAGDKGTISTNVYKKLTYHNLYEGIDVEYTFPNDKDGIKYTIIVHPGADLSIVKLEYVNADGTIRINRTGDAIIETDLGKFTDHAPISSYKEGGSVNVLYKINGNEESFNADYDRSKTLIIDPWTTALVFTGGYNDGYDVDYDYNGNVYVQGAWGPEQLAKYNSAGVKQWVFNETTFNTGSSQPCYGDFAVNRNNGECYCAEGDREITTGAMIMKINTNGVLMTTFPGNVNYQEMWRIAYNSCTNDLVIAGGGTNANNQAATLDTGLTTIILVNALAATCPYHDMVTLALDPNGTSCYMASSESCDFICTQASADDQLLKLPLPALTPNIFKTAAPSIGSFPEDIQDVNYMTWSGVPTNGFNGSACSPNFLYMYDGATVWQLSKTTGAKTKTKAIAGGTQQSWGGIDVDECDNTIYVGFKKTVQVYNSSLTLTSTLTANNTVYDVMLGRNYKTLYVTGHGFVQAINTGSTSVSTANVTNPATCGSCNGTARADLTLCGSIDTTGATYLWSNGATTHTITGLCAGTYTVTITPAGNCQTKYVDTVNVPVNPGLTVNVTPSSASLCSGGSTSLTASGATTYTWSPGTGLSATTGSTVTANPGTTTTYTVTGTTGGCNGTQTVTVSVTPTPTINVTPSSSTICSGNSVSLSATGATSYTWSPPGGLSCTSCPNPTANPGSTVTYTVTGTTAGCTSKDSVLITVNPTPTVNVTPASATLCSGGSTTLTASGATTYTWSPGTGLSGTTGAVVTANPGSTTTYTVTGTIGTCTASKTVTITIVATPTINVTPSSPSICSGGSVSLSATGATTYTWSPSGGLSCTSCPNPTANPGSTVTYTVTGTTGGCTSKDSVLITVNPTPTLNVTPSSSTICSGGSVSLNATGATSYTWSPPGGLSCTSCPNPTADPGSTVTYTVTGTTGGCPGKDSMLITVNPTPTLNVTPSSPTICSGNSTSLSVTGATSYTWSPPGGLSCTSCPNPTANPGSTTTYTVVGTTAGCTGKDSVTITINPTPTVTATTGVLTTICAGDSILLQAGGATTYAWNPAGSVACSTCQNTNAGPATTTTYTVTGTTNGCSSTATVQVNVNPTPTVTAIATTPTLCSGGSTPINVSGATTYTWSPSTGLSSTTGASVTATPATTTTYTVVGTNGSGCKDSAIVTVTITPTPILTVTPPSPGICGGDSVIMTASGASTYTWSPGTGLNATTGAVVTATPGTTTTYTITGSNGACSSTQTVTITVGALTVSATPGSPTICSGNSTTITATGAVTYVWSPATGLSSTTGSSVTANPGSTTTYTVVGSSGSGCKDSSIVTISVTPTPTLTVTPPSATICNGSNTSLTASGATTYSWLPATGLTCTNCPNPTASPGSTVTYTLTGTTGGCTSKDSVTITIDNPAISVATTGSTICSGSSTVLTASGGTSYLWSPSGGLSCTSCFNPTANPGSTTTYTVVGTDALGCKDSNTVTLTVNPTPTVSVTAIDSSICQGSATTLTASGASSYTWTPGTGLTCTNCTSTTANPTGTTTYTVIGTGVGGCNDTAKFTLTVNPTPTVSISLSTGNTICSGQSVTLTASGSTTYKWSTGSTASSITVTPAGTTTYTVKGSNGTCFDSASVTITLYPPLVVTMSTNDSICAGKTGQISASASGGNPPYTYSWNNGLGMGSGPFTVSPSSPTYYVCTVTDGCSSQKDSAEVYTFTSSPQAAFTAVPNTIMGGQYVTFVNTSTGASSYVWNLGNGSTSTDSSVYYQYLASGNYIVSLIVSNNFGCTDTAYDTVHVMQSIIVPNVFTPNGDGYNDVFHVTAGGFATYFIEIFNRWGEKVFEANSPDIDWNGRSTAGVEESDGTYYYIIKTTGYDGKAYNLTGYIQLIR